MSTTDAPIVPDVRERLRQQRLAAMQRAEAASRIVTPDSRAQALDLAEARKIPVAGAQMAVDSDPQRASLMKADLPSIATDHKALSKWLSDTDNFAVASDDIEGMRALSEKLKAVRQNAQIGSFGNDIKRAKWLGTLRLYRGFVYAKNMLGLEPPEETQRQLTEVSVFDEALRGKMSRQVQEHAAAVEAMPPGLPTVGALFSDARGLATMMTEQFVGSSPIMAGGLGGGLVAGRIGAMAGSFGAETVTELTGFMDEALQRRGVDLRDPEALLRGLSDPELMAAATAQSGRKAITTSLIDALSIELAGKRLGRAKGIVGKTAAAVGEAGIQTAASGASELGGQAAADPTGIDWKAVTLEAALDLPQNVGEIGMGAILARAAEGGAGSERAQEAVQEASRIAQSLADGQAWAEIKETFDASKVAQRAPTRASALIEMVGAPEVVSFRREAWDRVAKSAGKAPAQMAAETMPGGAQAYHEAVQTGSLAVPSRLAVEKLDAATFAALIPDMEGRPGNLTPKEADASLDRMESEIEAAGEEIRTLFQEGRSLEEEAAGLPEQIKAAEAEVAAEEAAKAPEADPAAPGLGQKLADVLGLSSPQERRASLDALAAESPENLEGRELIAFHEGKIEQIKELAPRLDAQGQAAAEQEIAQRRQAIREVRKTLPGDQAGPAERLRRLQARQSKIAERLVEIQGERAGLGQDQAEALMGKVTADLLAAGRGKSESRLLASVWVRALSTLSQRYGMSLGAMSQRFGLAIGKAAEGQSQAAQGPIEQRERGALTISKAGSGKLYTLTFYAGADRSTALHEFGHAFLDIMGDLSNEAAAPASLRADYAATLEYLGAAPGEDLGTAQHETFARSFEAYLFDGKAPSPEVRRIFATIRSWLTKLYRDIRALGVSLTPEVRGVFDRLLATDEEITAAEYESGASAEIDAEAIAQLEPDAQAAYWAAFHAAGDGAREQVQKALLKEISKESVAAFEAAVSDAKPALRAQIDALPGPVALDRMAAGTFPKLDRTEAEGVYDKATLKALDAAGALGADGITPDAAREALGFPDVDRMARDLVVAGNREALIDGAARAKVSTESGRFMSPKELKAQAREATRSQQYAARLRAELDVMNALAGKSEEDRKAAFRAVPPIQALRSYAEGKIAATAYRDMKPGQWLSSAKREARASKAAMQAGKFQDAAEAKARELLAFEMYRIMAEQKEAMATSARVIGRKQSDGQQETMGKAGGGFRNQVNRLSARFGFSEQRPDEAAETGTLASWIAGLTKQANEAEGSALIPEIAEWIVASEAQRHWTTLKPAELADVRDAIEQVYKLARDIHRAYAGNQAETLTERVEKVRARIQAGKQVNRSFQAKPTLRQKFAAEHSPIDRYVAEIDGEAGGPLFDAFLRLRNEAENAKALRRRAANKATKAAFSEFSAADKATWGIPRSIPGTERSLSREHVLMLALYEGSQSGRDLNRNTFTEAEVGKILETLTPADARWLNGMWELQDSYWPEFKALVEKVWGVAPPKIAAIPFKVTNAKGQVLELTGGYSRVKYEGARAHELSIADTANEIKQGGAVRAQPKAGSRFSRQEGVQQELRYDFGVVMEHVGEQIQILSVLEPIHDMNFVLRSVREDLIKARGAEVYDQFSKAFKELAVGRLGAQSAGEQVAAHLRAGVVLSKLGFKFGTNLINMTGLAASVDHLGPDVLREAAALNLNWVEFARAVKEMWAESDGMATRGESFNREASDIRGQLNKRFDMSSLEAIPMSMLAATQLWVDLPTYRVAKNKALAEGHDTAKAIAIAEQAVKDTQGSGLPADVPSIMREHKFLTVFMSYVNRQMNRTLTKASQTEWTNPASVGRLGVSLTLTWLVPAAFSKLVYGALRGDEDDDPFWLSTLEDAALSFLGAFVVVREIAAGYRMGREYSGPAGAAAFGEFADAAAALKDGKLTQRDFETTLSLAGIILHLPSAQALESYKGFQAYLRGRAGPQAVLIGPPRERR